MKNDWRVSLLFQHRADAAVIFRGVHVQEYPRIKHRMVEDPSRLAAYQVTEDEMIGQLIQGCPGKEQRMTAPFRVTGNDDVVG
jgi:hypothetical protein